MWDQLPRTDSCTSLAGRPLTLLVHVKVTWSVRSAARPLRAIAVPPRQQHTRRPRLWTAVFAPALALAWHSGFRPLAPCKLAPAPAQQEPPRALAHAFYTGCKRQQACTMAKGLGCPRTIFSPCHHAGMASALGMLPIADSFDVPAKKPLLVPPSSTPTRVPAAARGVEALMAATAAQLALHGVLHVGMRWLQPHAAVQTLHYAVGQQRLRGGCGCWLRDTPLHVRRPYKWRWRR